MSVRDVTLTEAERALASADALGAEAAAFVMDEDTFRAFYDRTARPVWGYLVRLTGDRQLADDLLQETYFRFLRAGSTYENEAHRRNALFRIATNLAHDAHRRQRTRPIFETHDDRDHASADDAARTFQQRSDLTRALDRLKPRERAMLWLAYAEGSSHREIAATLGVKTASVKLLLFRARRRLAGVLERLSAAPAAGARS
jgi:RNA polymerase sigma-70 factor (ECF subfamily)